MLNARNLSVDTFWRIFEFDAVLRSDDDLPPSA
jgi:hypothetical protein